MKIMTKLKMVLAMAFATFCVGSAQAMRVQLSVADWRDQEMRDSLEAITIEGEAVGVQRYDDMEQLEENHWSVEINVGFCSVRVKMKPGGRFDYSAVSLEDGWRVEEDGRVIISGEMRVRDRIQIPEPAERTAPDDPSSEEKPTSDSLTLKIPAGANYTYVVSNATEELTAKLEDGTNSYTVAKGSAVKVYFTPEEGYVWSGDFDNPKEIVPIESDTVIDESELPTALALMSIAVVGVEKTYDGQPMNVTWLVTNYRGEAIDDATICLREKGTDDWILEKDFRKYVNVTNATVEVKAEKKGFTTVTNEATVVINKASATIGSGSTSWTYDAKEHAYTNLTVTGFVTGEGLATTSDWATITNKGEKDNAFSFTLQEGTLESNYVLMVTTGTISVVKATINPENAPDTTWPVAGVDPEELECITDPEIPFSCFDTTNVYDGAEHTIDTNALEEAYKDLFLGNVPRFSYSLTSNGTYAAEAPAFAPAFTDVTVTSVWYKVSAANFEDVIHPAKVIITNRCVTLTSADGEWPYDGQAHSNMTVTGEGFVEGEGVTTNDFATITNVGSVPNAFAYEFLEGTKAENYSVACVTGTLTIAGYFVEYNGSGADGVLAIGSMPAETFGSTVATNLAPCAFTLDNFVFAGWTTNGEDKAYDNAQTGTDFVQSGETLSLTALWTRVAVPFTVTNLAHTTVTVWTNYVELVTDDVSTNAFGAGKSVYLAQTNATVTVVYRAVAGYMFQTPGNSGTVVIENLTYGDNNFVPERELPTVIEVSEVPGQIETEETADGNLVIKRFAETADGVVTVPESIGGKKVVAIADEAFYGASWLKELDCSVATSLTRIGDKAFGWCTGLQKITLPPNLETVGANAFDMCVNLKNVVLPAKLTAVGAQAFARCYSLAKVEFNGDVPTVNGGAEPLYSMFYGVNGFELKVPDSWSEEDVRQIFAGKKTWQTVVKKDAAWQCEMDPAVVTPTIARLFVEPGEGGVTVTNPIAGLLYSVESCTELGTSEWTPVASAKCSEADALAKSLSLKVEAGGGTQFFRVTVSEVKDEQD